MVPRRNVSLAAALPWLVASVWVGSSIISGQAQGWQGSVISPGMSPTVIASANGPFVLDSDRTVPITLKSTPGAVVAGRMMLLIRGVTATRQPGVLYRVFLGTPGSAESTEDDPHFAGTLNVFRARPAMPASPPPENEPVFESWDVTRLIDRTNSAFNLNPSGIPVIIAPIGAPDAGARVTIGRVELVSQ